MNLSSPTYIPTWVTPAPARAENRRISPGRRASMRGVTSAPAHGPLSGELLRGRVGRETQGKSDEGIGAERGPASPCLHLVTQAIEGAAPSQGIVHEDGEPDSVREGSAQPGGRAEFVDVRAIAVVPAPQMQLQAAALDLRPEPRREHEERCEPPGLSQPQQRRGAPPTCAAPCDGTKGAGPGA